MLELWQHLLDQLGSDTRARDLRNFLPGLRPLGTRQRSLVVEAPNRFAAEVIRQHYLALFDEALERVSQGKLKHVTLEVRRITQQELFPLPPAPPEQPHARDSLHRASLFQTYTFGNFVVGASNQFAHAAAKAVASRQSEHYNPLFIYGGTGLGKTHLVNAIAHEVLDRNPAARVVYLSAESFMNELIAALRRDRMDDFKNRFRQIDMLILDDVQFLAARERTQEEFFHTFNSLYEGHRQIVLTSDKFPKEIPELEERLRNRFEWGLIADIQAPDVETRVAIVQKKAELERIDVPHEVALFLATKVASNVRELEGSLTRLGAFASLNKCEITVDFARDVLKNTLRDRDDRAISIESIQKTVSDFFSLRPSELNSKKRTRTVALPRQVAMYFCRRYTQASFPVIGDRFGGRDHSTVVHANQVIERRIRSDPEFRATIERIERLIERAS